MGRDAPGQAYIVDGTVDSVTAEAAATTNGLLLLGTRWSHARIAVADISSIQPLCLSGATSGEDRHFASPLLQVLAHVLSSARGTFSIVHSPPAGADYQANPPGFDS